MASRDSLLDMLKNEYPSSYNSNDTDNMSVKELEDLLDFLDSTFNKKDGGLMVAIQKLNQGGPIREKYGIGGNISKKPTNTPYDPKASLTDMAKAIQTSSAGTDNQKLRMLMDYNMSVNPDVTPQNVMFDQKNMEEILGLAPNPNFNYMKPSGPAMLMPPMVSTGFRQDPGNFGNQGIMINGKRYMSEDEAIEDMGVETYNRFMAKGGMAGGKTYHQYHDSFVPRDEESMGYANGGGVGSMMQPKKKIPQLVKPNKDGSRPGYRGPGGYQGGRSDGPSGPSGNKGGDGPSARDRNMGLQGKTGKTDKSLGVGGSGVDRSKVSQFSQYGRNVMNQNLTTNNPSRKGGIFSNFNFNPLATLIGFINPFAGLLTRGIMGAKGKIGDLFGDFAGTMRGINPVTGKPNTQAEYEAMMADKSIQGRIDRMTDRMLAGKTFSQKNLDQLTSMSDRFGNKFGTNLGNIDNARGSDLRGQLNSNINTITNIDKPTANITAKNLNDFEIGNPGAMIAPNDFEIGNPGQYATTDMINEFGQSPEFNVELLNEFGQSPEFNVELVNDFGQSPEFNAGLVNEFGQSPEFNAGLVNEFGVKDRGIFDANQGLQFGSIPGNTNQGFGLMNSDAAKAAAMSVMSNAFNQNVNPGTSDMGYPDRNMNFPDQGELTASLPGNNLRAEITQADINRFKQPMTQMMDYDTYKSINTDSTLTPDEFNQLKARV